MPGPVTRAFGPETINFYASGPLNRLSFLRSDYTFLNAAFKHESTKFLCLSDLAGLIRPIESKDASPSSTLQATTAPNSRPTMRPRSNSNSNETMGPFVVSTQSRPPNHEFVFVGYKDVASVVGDPFAESEKDQIDKWSSSRDKSGVSHVSTVFLGIDESTAGSAPGGFSYKGKYAGTPYFAVDLTPNDPCMSVELQQKVEKVNSDLRDQTGAEFKVLIFGPRVVHEHYALYGQARMYIDWIARNRFCGGCGRPNMLLNGGCKLVCPPTDNGVELEHCHTRGRVSNLSFPRTDTSMIVAVVNHANDRVLLGRGKRFPSHFYSCLAGFLEPAEGIEECVRREVWEETGVKVGRVIVHSTQPWPYPANIMVGCIAEIKDASDESHAIHLEHDPELADAKWVTFDEVRAALALSLKLNRMTFEPSHPDEFLVPGPEAIAHVLLDAIVNKKTLAKI